MEWLVARANDKAVEEGMKTVYVEWKDIQSMYEKRCNIGRRL